MGKYEIVGGIVETPELGNIRIPPEKTGRKAINAGELVINTSITPEKLRNLITSVRSQGITEVPVSRLENRESEGR